MEGNKKQELAEDIGKDASVSLVEASIRSLAGLGVGYAAITSYRNKYDSIKKNFLGLGMPDSAKRAFTKFWAFSGEIFRKTELDVSLGTEAYTQHIGHQSDLNRVIGEVITRKREIRTILRGAKRNLEHVTENAARVGIPKETIDAMATPFHEFRENFDKQAIMLAEAITGDAYKGQIEKLEQDELRKLRWDQIEELAGKLRVVREQARAVAERMRDVDKNVNKTVEKNRMKLEQGLLKDLGHANDVVMSPSKSAADDVTTILMDTKNFMEKATTFSGWSHPLPAARPQATFWPVRTDLTDLSRDVSLNQMIGRKGVKSIGQTIKENYKESVLGAIPDDMKMLEEQKMVRKEFVKNLKDTVREMQRSGHFSNVEIGLMKADNDVVMLKATPKNMELFGGEDLVLRYEVPKKKFLKMTVQKGGKEFYVPFNRQKDLLLDQSRIYLSRIQRGLYDPTEAQAVMDRARKQVMNGLQVSKTGITDAIRSFTIDQKLTHRESKLYNEGWQAFDKIVKNKMGRGAILHIDTEFGADKFPTQVGWTLVDWKGRPIDSYHFAIGSDAAAQVPAHIKGKEMGGHTIVKTINRDQIPEMVEALQRTLNHPRVGGGNVQIAGKNWGMAEAHSIENLLAYMESKKMGAHPAISQLRIAIQNQTIIDVNSISTVSGESVYLSGSHIFKLIKDKMATARPEMKRAIEDRLRMIGIDGLTDSGQRAFEMGMHSAFQDSYMQALYAEVLYMTSKKGKKGQAALRRSINDIKNGFMPKHLLTKRFVPDGTSMNEFIANSTLNLSPQSVLGGKLETSWANVGGVFPDRRPGLEYRGIPSMEVRRRDSPAVMRKINKDLLRMQKMGLRPDPIQVMKKHLNDMHTKSVVFLDPGDTSLYRKDEVFFRSIYGRRLSIPDPQNYVVTHLAPGVKVGTQVGFGAPGGSKGASILGWENTREIHFTGRDNSQSGVVSSILSNDDGSWTVTVDRRTTFGTMTPVLTGSGAGLVSNRPMEELLPGLRPGFSVARTAEYAEKPGSSPGAAIADMFSLLFEHAGSDPQKKQILKSVIKEHFNQRGIGAGFPITERASGAGFLEFDARSRDFWRDNFSNVNTGDYLEIANEYNLRTGGTFTYTNMIMNGGKTMQADLKKESMEPALRTFQNLMSDTDAVEANVRISMRALRRETNMSEVTRVAGAARDLMRQGKVLEAIKMMRPDMNINDAYEFFNKSTAMFGFARIADLGWRPAGISKDVTNISDLDVMSGWGVSRQTGIGMDFMSKMRMLAGSERMNKFLERKLFEQNPVTIARMFPLSVMTGTHPIKGLRNVSAADAADFLKQNLSSWMNLPETQKLKDLVPVDRFYEVDGRIMTEAMAIEHLDVPKYKFEEAIATGRAKPVDQSVIRSRMRSPKDIDEIFRLSNNPALIHFGRDVKVQVKGETAFAKIERFMMTAPTKSDYFPIHVNGQKVMIESPIMDKQREIAKLIASGVSIGPFDQKMQELYDKMTDVSVKRNLDVYLKTKMVPVVALKQNLFTEYPQIMGSVTTRQDAMNVMEKVFQSKSITKKMFLHGQGIMLGEGRFVGATEELVDKELRQMFSGWSDDTLKAMANRALGSVRVGERSSINPRTFALQMAAGELKGHGITTDAGTAKWANNALGTLRTVAAAKSVGQAERAEFLDLVLQGVVAFPVFGEKAPVADQTKFVGSWMYKAAMSSQDRQELGMRLGTGTGGIGAVVHQSLLSGSNIDRDKDFLKILLEPTEEYLDIMKKNSFLPAVPHYGNVPAVVVAGNENGMVTFVNTVTKESWKEPMARMAELMNFDKSKTIEKMVYTKQFAGKTTVVGDNVTEYMWRYLSKKGGQLATDMGQKDIHSIMYQMMEMKGVMLENILKGKSVSSGGKTILDLMDNISNVEGVRSLRSRLESVVKDDPSHPLKKLFHKIPELEQYFQGTGGLNWFDTWEMAMKSGRTGDMATGYLSADEVIMGTDFKAGNIYNKKGAFARAMGDHEFLANIPTKFNPAAQETLMKSIKRNVQGEMDHATWSKVSKGMGWLAGAGAVYMAMNMFRSDDNSFLGDRPGVGGEAYDYTFTKPEYQMAGLLDTPFVNPYDKKRAYVKMDNPMFSSKMAKFNERENKDIEMVHRAVAADPIRSTFKAVGNKGPGSYKDILERYGHV